MREANVPISERSALKEALETSSSSSRTKRPMDSIGRLIELIGPYLGPTLGFGLAFLIIARLMREKRRPSATVAWLLLMLWVPVIGVPLYLIFGGRKISRLTQRKDRLDIAEPEAEGAIRSSPFGVLTRGNRTRVQATGEQAYRE